MGSFITTINYDIIKALIIELSYDFYSCHFFGRKAYSSSQGMSKSHLFSLSSQQSFFYICLNMNMKNNEEIWIIQMCKLILLVRTQWQNSLKSILPSFRQSIILNNSFTSGTGILLASKIGLAELNSARESFLS